MTCDEIGPLLAEYMAGGLEGPDRVQVERHLAGCADCRADLALWESLGRVPDAEPSPRLAERLQRLLAGFEAPAPRRILPLLPRQAARGIRWLAPAAAAACLLVGFLSGYLARGGAAPGGEMDNLRYEVRQMRAMVALSLLQQQSATGRLQGVDWSVRLEPDNREVASALLDALRLDPSVNVRLAAADALRHYASQGGVRDGLIEAAAATGQSPLVQIALIDLLVELKEERSAEVLRQIAGDTSVDESVRQRAEWGLERLG